MPSCCSAVKVPPLAAPQLAPCASSGRAWRLWAARHSRCDAQPLGAPPPPRGAKRAASKVADFTAFDPDCQVLSDDAHAAMPQNARRLKALVHACAGEAVPAAPKAARRSIASFFGGGGAGAGAHGGTKRQRRV